VHCLELILFLLVKVAHLGKNFRVRRNLGDQDVIPLESFTSHTNQLVNMSDLVKDLIRVGNNGVKFLESLQRFIVVTKALIDQAQVIDGLDTVGLYTNGLKEEFLCTVEVFVNEKSVTLVDKSFGVVSIVLNG